MQKCSQIYSRVPQGGFGWNEGTPDNTCVPIRRLARHHRAGYEGAVVDPRNGNRAPDPSERCGLGPAVPIPTFDGALPWLSGTWFSCRPLRPHRFCHFLNRDLPAQGREAPRTQAPASSANLYWPGPHPLTEERTFQHHFDITRPEPKEKPRKVRKPQPRKPRVRKPRVPTKTPEEQREARRAYEQTRSQTPDRKEYVRLQKQKARQERKEAGLCRICSSTAIPGQTKCEMCRDKHRVSRRASATKQREKARNAASTEAPGDQ